MTEKERARKEANAAIKVFGGVIALPIILIALYGFFATLFAVSDSVNYSELCIKYNGMYFKQVKSSEKATVLGKLIKKENDKD